MNICEYMMSESIDCTKFLKVKCDWQSNVDGMDIEDCIVAHLHQPEHETPEIDIIDLIEKCSCNCVNFSKPEDTNDLFINISCDSIHLIREIAVYSEAKTIELFGKTGEYLSTHSAVCSKDVIDYPMNSHSIHINSRNCSLKFEQMKNSNFIWIYGIVVHLIETDEHSNKYLGPINMQNVHHLMNPESLVTNASKLFSSLSLKESKSNSNDFVTSILNNLGNTAFLEKDNGNTIVLNNFKQFEKSVEDKLNIMALQINTIGNNVETLNKKFDTLLKLLQEKKML